MITNFLSNRTNLIILQCLLYILIGYIMGSHLEWSEIVVMYVIILVLQFVTHIRAVADGMVYNQLMNDNKDFKEFIKKIKENKSGDK